MRVVAISLILSSLLAPAISSQAQGRRGSFFFYWGYNASVYTKSDIHLWDEGDNYDFTLRNVKARHMPVTHLKYLASFYCPYNYRIGYHISDKLSISAGLDHMKYKVVEDQTVKIDGHINPALPEMVPFAGTYQGDDIVISNDFFKAEHSDGLNYISTEVDYQFYTKTFGRGKIRVDIYAGAGVGIMYPRTESYLFGNGANHPFHISGWGTGAHIYPRFFFGKYFFIQPTTKAGFISMPDVFSESGLPTQDRFSQKFSFMQWNLVFGATIPAFGGKKSE